VAHYAFLAEVLSEVLAWVTRAQARVRAATLLRSQAVRVLEKTAVAVRRLLQGSLPPCSAQEKPLHPDSLGSVPVIPPPSFL
jgi:hypothetical protein